MDKRELSERDVERALRNKVREAGGIAFKFVSPGISGVPDRIVVLPDNHIGFVEVKKPGKKTKPEQEYRIRRLQKMGCYVTVLDDPEDIDMVISGIMQYGKEGDDLLTDILDAGGLL